MKENIVDPARISLLLNELRLPATKVMVRWQLKKIAEVTGGRAFFLSRKADLDPVYEDIDHELRTQYLLAYTSSSTRPADELRKVEVKVDRKKVKSDVSFAEHKDYIEAILSYRKSQGMVDELLTSLRDEAKVELNLSPRPLKTDSGDELPGYRVTARLRCRGAHDDEAGPRFKAQVVVEAIYRQMDGDPVDVAAFGANHASLTRQLYPLLQQELRGLMLRLGLERIQLPFDLPARVEDTGEAAVEVSGSVH